jgi:drug/metabolite transporter (DMT)-like permease
MAIFFGLASAFGWGVADFWAGNAARHIGTYRTLFFMQFVGLAALSLYLGITGELVHMLQPAYLVPWLWALLAGSLNIIASLLFYRALEIGTMAIASPIIASYSAITVILSVFTGERISTAHSIGLVASIIGVTLAALSLRSFKREATLKASDQSYQSGQPLQQQHRLLPPGVLLAILGAVGYGVLFWLLGFRVTPYLGGVIPVWLERLMAACILPVVAYPARQSLRVPRGGVWWFLLGVGIFDTIGYTTNTLGLATGQVAIVSVLASCFTAVTMLLAALFLRERLQWSQWGGIGLIFVGIVLINI